MASNTRHLKRHSMPTSWPIKRKNINFIVRSNPGSHKRKYSTALVIILRDILKYSATSKEAKIIVNTSEILINGKIVKDIKFSVGIFDVIEIKKTNEKFVLIYDELGKLKLVPTKDNLIYLKIIGKKVISNKKCQINLMNGFNLLIGEKEFNSIKVNDSIIYDFANKKISSILNLSEKSMVYIYDGKFKGQFGEVVKFTKHEGLTRDVVFIQIGKDLHSTAKDYCYVIGTKSTDLKRFA